LDEKSGKFVLIYCEKLQHCYLVLIFFFLYTHSTSTPTFYSQYLLQFNFNNIFYKYFVSITNTNYCVQLQFKVYIPFIVIEQPEHIYIMHRCITLCFNKPFSICCAGSKGITIIIFNVFKAASLVLIKFKYPNFFVLRQTT
jgi:hypothetical protein